MLVSKIGELFSFKIVTMRNKSSKIGRGRTDFGDGRASWVLGRKWIAKAGE